MDTCPICDRDLIPGPSIDDHHLIPKTFKGKETVTIHRICHRKLHTLWTEREMAHYYHTIERIREHPDIITFVKWISKKHPEFYEKGKDTRERRAKRRR